jgi:hypothetical protein
MHGPVNISLIIVYLYCVFLTSQSINSNSVHTCMLEVTNLFFFYIFRTIEFFWGTSDVLNITDYSCFATRTPLTSSMLSVHNRALCD